MIDSYLTVSGQSCEEITINKSRFIGYASPCPDESCALDFLQRIREEHKTATHHCYAYILGPKSEIRRFSDDKEPQGTAGKPILETISSGGFLNTAIVVTRYFGGVLLGTGGLVRAYSQAASKGLKESSCFPIFEGSRIQIECGYAEVSKLQHLLRSQDIPILNSIYEEKVSILIASEKENSDNICKKITEAANGAASVTVLDSVYFIKDGSEAKIYQF